MKAQPISTQQSSNNNNPDTSGNRWRSVKEAAKPVTPFSEAALRNYIFHADRNGFSKFIARINGKILLDVFGINHEFIEQFRQGN